MKIDPKIIVLNLAFLLLYNLFAQDIIDLAKNDIKILTSREFMGRGYSKNGHIKASEYIKEQFEKIGLEKINNSYYQRVKFHVNLVEYEPILILNETTLLLGKEFLPFALSGSGKCKKYNKIIYVGNGLYIPDKGINDYAEKPIQNSILIIDDNIPDNIKKDKSISREYYSRQIRIEIAKKLHAKALIFIVPKIGYSTPYKQENIPIFDIQSSSVPERIKSVTYQIKTDFKKVESNNVLGLLPGTTYKDSTIIICAHYDHLGCLGDSIFFPGANDNGSGIGIMLSLARTFKLHPLKYSLLFISFTGEDAGLCGSKYFAENPTIDLNKCKFLLNFDMVASGEDGIVAVGGANHLYHYNLLTTINDSLQLGKLGKRKNAPNGDHWYITQKGVKAFYLYTKDGKQPYHHIDDIYDTLEWDDFYSVYELSRNFLLKL